MIIYENIQTNISKSKSVKVYSEEISPFKYQTPHKSIHVEKSIRICIGTNIILTVAV